MLKYIVFIITVVLIGLFAYFVWPTSWQTYQERGSFGEVAVLRSNRFTGQVQELHPWGWESSAGSR